MAIKRRHMLALSGAAVFSTAAFGYMAVNGGHTGLVTPANAQSVSDLMEEQALPDMVLGDENAPVTIIEYASMTCPHCATFHAQTLPGIKEKYVDTGKVKMILREFPFDPRAAAAFMLARCAPPAQYYPMIDVLFQQQREWATAEDARAPLMQIAKLAGFTQESFEACLKNQELLDKVRQVQQKAANDYGVQSTPTFFINGEKHTGALSVEEMSTIIDGLL